MHRIDPDRLPETRDAFIGYWALSASRDWMQRWHSTGQRGYILTGKSTYLAPYRQAVQTVQPLPSKLRQLVKDSPVQLARVHALELALQAKLEELQQTLAALDTRGLTSARAVVLSDVGREHMDRIRALVSQINGGTLYIDNGKPAGKAFGETLRNLREIAPTVYFNVPKGWRAAKRRLRNSRNARSSRHNRSMK